MELKFNLHFPFFRSVVSSVDSSGFIRLKMYMLRAYISCRGEGISCTLEQKRLDQSWRQVLHFKKNRCIETMARLVTWNCVVTWASWVSKNMVVGKNVNLVWPGLNRQGNFFLKIIVWSWVGLPGPNNFSKQIFNGKQSGDRAFAKW